jgi:hypothetical protein
MKPSALILLFILPLALLGCVRPSAVRAPLFGASIATPASCNASTFLSKVHFLRIRFSPASQLDQDPPADTNSPISANIQQDLIDAFNDAPPDFKTYLCETLDGIYINPCLDNNYDSSSCGGLSDTDIINNSWGFRKISSSPNRYVALSLGLWRNGHAPLFLDFETRRIQALLRTFAPNVNVSKLPSFSAVDPSTVNTSGMSVLAALAHEAGHVYWFDVFVGTPNGPADTTTPTSFCSGQQFYSSRDWPYPIDAPPGRWIDFGEMRNVDNTSDLLKLPGLLHRGHDDEWPDHIRDIYQNDRRAGILAAFSPDEDFVKTLEAYIVVRNTISTMNSLIVTIPRRPSMHPPNYTVDVISNLRRPNAEVRRKALCFGSLPW